MKSYDFRIKKLEERLNPKGKTVTVITKENYNAQI